MTAYSKHTTTNILHTDRVCARVLSTQRREVFTLVHNLTIRITLAKLLLGDILRLFR